MMFTELELHSFIELYRNEFGETIGQAEALKQATALVSLVERVYRPMTREEMNIVMNKFRHILDSGRHQYEDNLHHQKSKRV